MEIGEQHLTASHQPELGSNGSFTFTTMSASAHTSSADRGFVRRHDEFAVGHRRSDPGTALDQDVVAART